MRLKLKTISYWVSYTILACMVYFPLSYLFIEAVKLVFGPDILDYMLTHESMFRYVVAHLIYFSVLFLVGGSIVNLLNKKFLIKAFKFNEINGVRR